MKVKQLINHLLDQPMNNTVYVGDLGVNGRDGRTWDGEVQGVVGSGLPGVMATFIEFNENGLNAALSDGDTK